MVTRLSSLLANPTGSWSIKLKVYTSSFAIKQVFLSKQVAKLNIAWERVLFKGSVEFILMETFYDPYSDSAGFND